MLPGMAAMLHILACAFTFEVSREDLKGSWSGFDGLYCDPDMDATIHLS
jgi:hypothetical protein